VEIPECNLGLEYVNLVQRTNVKQMAADLSRKFHVNVTLNVHIGDSGQCTVLALLIVAVVCITKQELAWAVGHV